MHILYTDSLHWISSFKEPWLIPRGLVEHKWYKEREVNNGAEFKLGGGWEGRVEEEGVREEITNWGCLKTLSWVLFCVYLRILTGVTAICKSEGEMLIKEDTAYQIKAKGKI